MTTKEQFLKEKLNNFTKFVKENIGIENNIYQDLLNYEKNFELFLKDIIQLAGFAKNNEKNWYFEDEHIAKFLETKGIKKKLSNEIINKVNQYFSMFIKVLNY